MNSLEECLCPSNYLDKEVVTQHNPNYDKEYVSDMQLLRVAHSGMKGKIFNYSNSHGLCFAVKFSSGAVVFWEPGELMLI